MTASFVFVDFDLFYTEPDRLHGSRVGAYLSESSSKVGVIRGGASSKEGA